ncbi:hypothetical protein AYI69_g7747 [Smittium culicis]|uniref:Uncharacterized protein n=1 Tax=Smittium culicis TaxID=133412 RepID=A0A1R1XPW2_9FUNG|nr:hypothetical protein AYI69_g7747 [Smittium culicis]
MQEIIKANRSEDLLKIKKLEDENLHLKEQLVIQTKKIDRLTHQIQEPTQTVNQTVQPPSDSVVSTPAPPITFNFGTSQAALSTHSLATPFKKLSYSEIAKSQSKNAKEAKVFTKSIRKLVGTKPINSGTRAEKDHKLARIYVQADEVKAAYKAAYIALLKKSIENSKKPEMVQFMTEILAEIEAIPDPGS